MGLTDIQVLRVLEEEVERRKEAVSLADLRTAVNDCLGESYSQDKVAVRVNHLENGGFAESRIDDRVGTRKLRYVRPTGTDYGLPAAPPLLAEAPVTQWEIQHAKRITHIGDIIPIRVLRQRVMEAPEKVEKAVKVTNIFPHICQFSDGRSAQWQEMAKFYRKHRAIDLT